MLQPHSEVRSAVRSQSGLPEVPNNHPHRFTPLKILAYIFQGLSGQRVSSFMSYTCTVSTSARGNVDYFLPPELPLFRNMKVAGDDSKMPAIHLTMKLLLGGTVER